MSVPLSHEAERLIEEKIRSGRYRSAEEVVLAGLGSLEQEEHFGEFQAGEWDALLKTGEDSLRLEISADAPEVFRTLRERISKPST